MRTTWNGIAAVRLQTADGATALIAEHGAHVLSWVPAGGEEVLFLSDLTRCGPGAAIRGGVPVIFPQFSERGNGPRHGFARTIPWRTESATSDGKRACARFSLIAADVASPCQPDDFRLD